MMIPIVISYTFTPSASVKISSGHGRYGVVDQTYQTSLNADGHELYMIPGPSIKGKIRFNYRRLLSMMPKEAAAVEKDLFGTPYKSGWARFSALRPQSTMVKTEQIAATSVDRFRRAATTGSLRLIEYAAFDEENPLLGTIEGYVPTTEKMPFSVACLIVALLQTNQFGGGSTSGYGKGKIAIQSVTVGDAYLEGSSLIDMVTAVMMKKGD